MTGIHEVNEGDVLRLLGWHDGDESVTGAVLMFTPLCGTCKIAERMLEIVAATTVAVEITKLNINYAPRLREEWRISSVPCLVLLRNGRPVRFEYAMRSVDHLYELLKSLESAG
ncbi:thioredoxin family protein [Paenibacillus oenotherae]|uniref:Thioredoxin family protein n=1 Tax=Paenibacillus oenotherae TaxID=1435645 RepID=A0ABS7D7B4_9BACL|nr:thioredoxin family protein [Paenibacillus oenotherae]MBW7475833.1 thioredoxin family protein [Paenibacillus oenotherae]